MPDMTGRYYSVQFTDLSNNTIFAYVGKRTTGTKAGDYLEHPPDHEHRIVQRRNLCHPLRHGSFPAGAADVESDSDLSTAHNLTRQIQLVSLRQPSQ